MKTYFRHTFICPNCTNYNYRVTANSDPCINYSSLDCGSCNKRIPMNTHHDTDVYFPSVEITMTPKRFRLIVSEMRACIVGNKLPGMIIISKYGQKYGFLTPDSFTINDEDRILFSIDRKGRKALAVDLDKVDAIEFKYGSSY